MARLRLSLDNLRNLDMGKAAVAFDGELLRMASDCQDRPGDPTAREVSLTLKIVPVMNPDGTLETANVQIFVQGKTPVRRTRPYMMPVTFDGFTFNEDNLSDDHPTLAMERNYEGA